MLELSPNDIDIILSEEKVYKPDSNLGYFSKPYRKKYKNLELIIKKYLPVRDKEVVSEIIENHNKYIEELKALGISVPDTLIRVLKTGKKSQIIIIQEAFRKDELLRNMVESSPETELQNLCKMIFDETLKFRNNRKDPADIGFHPTLRNFAIHKGIPHYFDTFPPMLMKQRDLNRIIVKMSPFGNLFKIFIPLNVINLVSNEYYNFEKMFTGIVGSCCRLRTESIVSILAFSRVYIEACPCSSEEKRNILKALQSPPDLPGIWTLFRRLSGNVGKPNVKFK